jgi:hypothetical protein
MSMQKYPGVLCVVTGTFLCFIEAVRLFVALGVQGDPLAGIALLLLTVGVMAIKMT